MVEPETRPSLMLRLRQAADQQAWTEFVSIYEPLLLRLMKQRGLQEADARDVTQQVILAVTQATPDHSSLSKIGDRLPVEVYEEVFGFVLKLVHEHGLLSGKTVGVDSTLIEANAAMKSIVRMHRLRLFY